MKLSGRYIRAIVFCTGAAAALALAATQAMAQQQTDQPLPQAQAPGQSGSSGQSILREQHGDWQIRCEAAAGTGARQCAMLQNIESAVRRGFGLVVMVLKTSDGKTKMRIAAPHGVFLPKGLELRVDNEIIGTAPFVFCDRSACRTEATLSDPIIEKLKAGKEALFVLFEAPQKGTGLVVSLNGFTAALAALPQWPAPGGAEAASPPAGTGN